MRSVVFTACSSSSLLPPHNHHFLSPHRHFLSPRHLYLSKHPTTTTTTSSLSDTASHLAEAGRFEELKLLMGNVIGSDNAEEVLSSEVLVCGIVKEIREGRVKGVAALFEWFSRLGFDVFRVFDDNLVLLSSECSCLVENGDLEEAVELLEVLAGLRFSVKDLVRPSDFIRKLVNKRSPYLAVRYASLLPHSEVVYCTMIREFGKRTDLVSALKVYEASKQKLTEQNMYLHRTVIDVCGLCGNPFKSRLIYEDLLNQKVTPNIFVFNSLMNVNSHDLTYTMKVYKQMQDFAVAADMTSYNILLKACCLSERVDLAQDIYAEVRLLESTGALKLDVFTYSTIIKVFADAKLWQMAIKVKEDMLSAGVTPNTVTWSSLISACANAGLVDQATQLFEEMLMAGCEPNSLCFNSLLHACVEGCQYDRAFHLFSAWKSTSSSDKSTDNSSVDKITSRIQPLDKDCIAIQQHVGSDTRHLSLAKSTPFEPTTATYNILLKACGTDIHRAKGLIDEMKASNLSPNQISWSILIDIYGASGNVQGALEILKTMRETGMKLDVIAYTTAIKVCVENKYLKTAFSLFVEMKRNRVKPNLVTYNTLLRARTKYGSLQEIQQCLAIYQDMQKAGYKSNDDYLKLLIGEWCEGVLQNNNQEREYKLRDKADIGGLRSLLLDRVATQLQKNTAESLAVDIQGLTKVEARLVVLAVLRMIKENYVSGCPVQDDLVVILGILEMDSECIVRDAITMLLKKELGLEVLPVNPSFTIVPKGSNLQITLENSELLASVDAPARRRPTLLQKLVVTKKSLNNWLRRKLNAAFRR
ncbi:hypothetical protein vseg_013608 [Gypsophila vaccaria]